VSIAPCQRKENFRRAYSYFLLCLLSLFFTSCARIHYSAGHSIPVFLSQKKSHHRPFRYTEKKDFYLIGFIPKVHEVSIDKVGKQEGFSELSQLQIEEHATFGNIMTAIFSLGLYTPRTVVLKGWGI
jgi:hypothetical protein